MARAGVATKERAVVPLSDEAFRRKHCAAAPVPPRLNDVIEKHAKLSRRRRQAPAAPDIGPTDAQLARGCYQTEQVKDPEAAAPRFVKRAMDTRNLERWLHRGMIDEKEFAAGLRYRTDWELSGWAQRMVARYNPAQGFGGEPVGPGPSSLRQMDAWDRWRAAHEVLPIALREGFDQVTLHDRSDGNDGLGLFTARTMRAAVAVCIRELVAHYRI